MKKKITDRAGIYTFLFIILAVMGAPAPAAGQSSGSCGTDDRILPAAIIQAMQASAGARIVNTDKTMKLCRVAVEINSDTYLLMNGDTGRIKRTVLETIMHCSRQLEAQTKVRLTVTDIRIWKNPAEDPFSGTRSTNEWLRRLSVVPARTPDFDKRIFLFSGPSSDNAGIAILAGKHCVSPIGSAEVTLHELGHTFGSPHTHHCSWPGGPIDYCAQPEGGYCHSALEYSLTGTVMSYCGDRSLQLHPLVVNVVRQHAEQFLGDIATAPSIVHLDPESEVAGDDFFTWRPSPGASSYELEYTETGTTDTRVLLSAFNGISTSSFDKGRTYRVRVKAINEAGASEWSPLCTWHIIEAPDRVPKIILPVFDGKPVIPGTSVSLEYSAVNGAQHYEVEVSYLSDYTFQNPMFRGTSSSTALSFSSPQQNSYRWRVRAVTAAGAGKWSETGFFTLWRENSDNRFKVPAASLTQVPRSFPYYYVSTTPNALVRVTLSENKDMTDPVAQNVHEQVTNSVTGHFRNLPPGKRLYLHVEERNDKRWVYPEGPLLSFIMEINTVTEDFPTQVLFSADMGIPSESGIGTLSATPGYVWYASNYRGLRQLDIARQTSRLFTLENTGNRWGFTNPGYVTSDKKGQLRLLGVSSEGYRYTTLAGNDFSGDVKMAPVYSKSIIKGLDPDADLFWEDRVLLKLSGSFFNEVVRLPQHQDLINVRASPDKVYLLVYNKNISRFQVLTADPLNWQVTAPDPVVHPWSQGNGIRQIEVSSDGKLWVLRTGTNNQPLVTAADNSGYTDYGSPLPGGQNIAGFYLSPAGIPYVQVYDASGYSSIYKLTNGLWEPVGQPLPLLHFSGSFVADEQGNYWIGNAYGLTMVRNCDQEYAPTLDAIPTETVYNLSTELKTEGCPDGAVWSWSGSLGEPLSFEGNILSVKLTRDTAFRVKCKGNCAVPDTTLLIKVIPVLDILSLNKRDYCHGDSATVVFSIKGLVSPNPSFSVKLVAEAGTDSVSVPFALNFGSGKFRVPETLVPGNYKVFLHTTGKPNSTGTSSLLTIRELPTASLSADKTEILTRLESAEIRVTLTGSPPWHFTDWNGQTAEAVQSPFITAYTTETTGSKEIVVSSLSDKYCTTGSVKNSVVISGIMVTGTEEDASGIRVYPNPAPESLQIVRQAPHPGQWFYLASTDGRTVRSIFSDSAEAWMPLSGLAPGAYILWTVHQGKKQSWKIIKQN